MIRLTQNQIKEIAEQLDCGFRCFWHKTHGEFIFIPNENKNPEIDMDAWSEEIEKLDTDFLDYDEIDQLESSDSFEIMVEFIESIEENNNFKDKLIRALDKNKPFREFKIEIDNSGEYRQKWFDFKNKKLQEWVIRNTNRIIQNRENIARA